MQDDVFDGQKPEIEYPLAWGYRVVGASEEALRFLIAELLADDEHVVHDAQPSSKGTYVSVRLSVTVRDELHRDDVYRRLSEAEIVKMVL
ncbi:MAG: DUF493 domain-containing protein [Planctomycetota bacterium]|nr:DUF493 domain-containing protein [Planctomycetota bacterium]